MRAVLIILGLAFCLGLGAQDLDYVKAQAELLSAADMNGRGYVNDGLGRAADHLAKEYKRIGLEPLAPRFRQSFMHSVNTFPGAMDIVVEGSHLVPGVEFLINPSSPSLQGDYRVKMMKARDFDTSPDIFDVVDDCDSCIIAIDVSAGGDKELISKAQKFKAQLATYRPVIWVTADKLTWSVSTEQSMFPVIVMSPNVVMDHYAISIDVDAKFETKFESENIIGMVPGSLYPDSFVVFTAHYDHLGMMGQEATFYGANDNASGTAFILSLAKHYAANPAPYTTVFIAFAAEEAGLIGSKYFVEQPLIDLKSIRFLINLDLMGSGVDGITVVNAPAVASEFELLKSIDETAGLLPKIKSRKQTANSDHYYFAETGVPAVFIYALGGTTAYHDIHDDIAGLTFAEYPDIFTLITIWVSKL